MDNFFKEIFMIIIKAIVSFAIAGGYALLRMELFGDTGRVSEIESLIVFVGSITLGCVLVNLLLSKKK